MWDHHCAMAVSGIVSPGRLPEVCSEHSLELPPTSDLLTIPGSSFRTLQVECKPRRPMSPTPSPSQVLESYRQFDPELSGTRSTPSPGTCFQGSPVCVPLQTTGELWLCDLEQPTLAPETVLPGWPRTTNHAPHLGHRRVLFGWPWAIHCAQPEDTRPHWKCAARGT